MADSTTASYVYLDEWPCEDCDCCDADYCEWDCGVDGCPCWEGSDDD